MLERDDTEKEREKMRKRKEERVERIERSTLPCSL